MNARTTPTATPTTTDAAEWEFTRCISRTLDGIRAGDPVAAERHARAALDAAKLYAADKKVTAEDLHRLAAAAKAARGHAQRKGTGFARTVLFLRGAGGHLIHAVSQRH